MLALPSQLVEKFLLSLLLRSLCLLDPLRQLGHFTAQRVSLPFQRDEVLMLRLLLAQRSFQRRRVPLMRRDEIHQRDVRLIVPQLRRKALPDIEQLCHCRGQTQLQRPHHIKQRAPIISPPTPPVPVGKRPTARATVPAIDATRCRHVAATK